MRATGCEEVGVVDSGVGVVQAIYTLANSLSLARSTQPHPSLQGNQASTRRLTAASASCRNRTTFLPAPSLPSTEGRERVRVLACMARVCWQGNVPPNHQPLTRLPLPTPSLPPSPYPTTTPQLSRSVPLNTSIPQYLNTAPLLDLSVSVCLFFFMISNISPPLAPPPLPPFSFSFSLLAPALSRLSGYHHHRTRMQTHTHADAHAHAHAHMYTS